MTPILIDDTLRARSHSLEHRVTGGLTRWHPPGEHTPRWHPQPVSIELRTERRPGRRHRPRHGPAAGALPRWARPQRHDGTGAGPRRAARRLFGRASSCTCGSAACSTTRPAAAGEPFGRCPFWTRGRAARLRRLGPGAGRAHGASCAPASTAPGSSRGWSSPGLLGRRRAELREYVAHLPAAVPGDQRGRRRRGGHRLQQALLAGVLPAHRARASTCGWSTWSATAGAWPTPGPRRCRRPEAGDARR